MADPANITSVPGIQAAPEATPPADAPAGFKPYVPDEANQRELTFQAVVTGTCLGLIFAASSLYLVLKVGMTVSASIPVAVLAITLFRAFAKMFGLRPSTILENNIVQTSGSAGESIAFGVGVTMPALLLLGFQMDATRIMVVSILGGLLGILAMIPLRRAFIVGMHGRPGQPGTLLYPEGTACAQVLISGEKGGSSGQTVFVGFGLAFVHKFLTEGMKVVSETVAYPLTFINKAANVANNLASELLGVGYIIGLRTSAIMMAGAILGYLIIIPLIFFAGQSSNVPVPPGEKPISQMSIPELRNNYLLFIGAGCVATAGIISMLRTLPMIFRSVGSGLRTMRAGGGASVAKRRTEDDMPMSVVILGSVAMVCSLAVFLAGEVGPVSAIAGAVLVVLFGFLFVTVSARLTGEIGSSSNPISGMTVATLMVTCLIFVGLGWTGSMERLLALSVAAVVCIASSNGGTTAQSLKTGFLVGGTPKAMQWAILVGAFVSALAIGFTLIGFNWAGTVYSSQPENVPSFTFTKAEVERLRETERHQGKTYKVWSPRNDLLTAETDDFKPRKELLDAIASGRIKKGKAELYLIDPDTGRIEYLVDPAIMGKLTKRDDGSKVSRDFDAPKTQVMGLIINGVMGRDLNWSMVGIGALIAVMLELCGVSALAFAVGVYVPIQYSVPIFLGGICRWGVDAYLAQQAAAEAGDVSSDPEARARAEVEAIKKSETSPGVLLASGYIAGGSLAGVLLAFFAFSPVLTKDIGAWEHGTATVAAAGTLQEQAEAVARLELGLVGAELGDAAIAAQKNEKERQAMLARKERLEKRRDEIVEVNEEEGTLARYASVPAGTNLTDPDTQAEFTVEEATTLGDVARSRLGRTHRAKELWSKNKAKLPLPKTLPAGAELHVPKTGWPAFGVFGLLIAFLVVVGMGFLFRSPPEESQKA
ncbi:MAG: oligopeptide transporter, OPT family [Gemmataceae bacterium]|nr:oligopeptide transporter, OPT family [Gemmataceae bacterium]